MKRSLVYGLCILSAIIATASPQAVPVRPGEVGLVYETFKDGDRIPDFSNCGYRGGGVAIPEVPVTLTMLPLPTGDDTARIQAAIDVVAARQPDSKGFRGAVLLKRGVYRVAGTLSVKKSGVVLRGEGQSTNGTLIRATERTKRTLIEVGGGQEPAPVAETSRDVDAARVPVGARRLPLVSASGLAVGDAVAVIRSAAEKWLAALGVDRLNRGPEDKVRNWTTEGYTLAYERRVTSIKGNTITIDAPVVCALDREYGGGAVAKLAGDARIRYVGIEHLRLVSEYDQSQGHSDEAHAWDAIRIAGLADGWVRNVTAVHFGYSCVNIVSSGIRITVQDCACLDPISRITGGRRYSFALDGQLCLVQRCYTRGGRHDYVMHSRARGPNVFLDCVADRTHSDSGPHHRWATGTLYDNIACGALNVQWRGRSGTGHGWAGANMVFWNCRTRSIDCRKPPTANNYCIGCTGSIGGNGYIASAGSPVEPRSLYLAQLAERLGPKAVEAITTPAQRQGVIDKTLREMLEL